MFISDKSKIDQLSDEISGLSAIEMEGAAFAQVAFQEKLDWMVLRVISDEANENASSDFKEFLDEYKLKSFDLISSFLSTFLK
jgi:adenosylhomocysteine nucleosidase